MISKASHDSMMLYYMVIIYGLNERDIERSLLKINIRNTDLEMKE